MANKSEVGISPVLLQAISQTLSSTSSPVCHDVVSQTIHPATVESSSHSVATVSKSVRVDGEMPHVRHIYLADGPTGAEAVAFSPDKLSQAVLRTASASESSKHYVVCSESETLSPVHTVSYTLPSSEAYGHHNTFVEAISDGELIRQSYENTQPIVTTSPINKSGSNVSEGVHQPVAQFEAHNGETIVVVQNVDEMQPQDVKSEQHLQDSMGRHIVIKRMMANDADSTTAAEEVHISHEGISMGTVLSAIASHLKMKGVEQEMQITTDTEMPQQIIVTFNGNEGSVASTNEVMVADTEGASTQQQTSTSGEVIDCMIDGRKVQVLEGVGSVAGNVRVSSSSDNMEGVAVVTTEPNGSDLSIAVADVVSQTTTGEPCPICGDKISGYHYGIYTCESCKGFFKRTVQNRKSFVCHRKGDCEINVANRKKCPACRFKRCLDFGMKLAAIREDRSRGGRSSYDGCLPFTSRPPGTSTPTIKSRISKSSSASTTTPTQSKASSRAIQACSQLAAMLSPSAGSLHKVVRPQKPQILLDLMNIESLSKDEDVEQDCCEGKLAEGDTDMFGSLLHLADHCLYKIVRWARNLPDFTSLSTDDQILLLQNCWAELLCLSCCWASVHAQGEIRLSHNRVITLEKAEAMGIRDIIQRMCDFVEHLRRMEVDHCEYVTLRVMTLMTPDVKGLKEEKTIRFYQEKLTDALHVYTSTHYPHNETKLAEMVTRLPQVSRICIIAKEQLTARQAVGEIPQYSLLSELLKGDMLLQQSS